MNDWQQDLSSYMQTAMMVAMVKAFIGPGLEKKLGRPVTDYDWQVYQEEQAEKEQFYLEQRQREEILAPWNNLMAQFQQLTIDRQKIRDFVWKGR